MNLKNIFAVLFKHQQSATETVRQAEPQTEHQSFDDGHEWVDLGLPSGTLWATCNVGASQPEEYGDFFAWGETVTKTEFNWATYRHCKGEKYTMTKYVNSDAWGLRVDNLVELLPEDDAATVNWGDNWQMPSTEQFRELIDKENTTIQWKYINGISGKLITSKANGNRIFIPAAGIRGETKAIYEGSDCICWSRSLNIYAANEADYLLLPTGGYNCIHYNMRGYGLTVRPVRVLKTNTKEKRDYEHQAVANLKERIKKRKRWSWIVFGSLFTMLVVVLVMINCFGIVFPEWVLWAFIISFAAFILWRWWTGNKYCS